MSIVISPSLLGYEHNIDSFMDRISTMICSGVRWLHIDVMRPPFIPDRLAFTERAILRLCTRFRDEANFDFHLMMSDPRPMVRVIDRVVGSDKSNTSITIHRESFRDGLGRYTSKDFDLFDVDTGDRSHNDELRWANSESGKQVCETLGMIKGMGYMSGLALEPGTSVYNVSERMLQLSDMILLMGVSSGAGGQKYSQDVTKKISYAKERFKGKIVQVDGGVNESTIPEIVNAGADNIVVGSYITNARNPEVPIGKIMSMLRHDGQ